MDESHRRWQYVQLEDVLAVVFYPTFWSYIGIFFWYLISPRPAPDYYDFVSDVFWYGASICALIYFVWKRFLRPGDITIADMAITKPQWGWVFVAGTMLGWLLQRIASLFNQWLAEYFDPRFVEFPYEWTVQYFQTSWGLWYLVIQMCILTPVFEEFTFRGVFYSWLRSRGGIVISLAVSSLLFALFHISWNTYPSIFLVAVGLGLLREFSGSVWPGIACHASLNLIWLTNLYAYLES